MPTLAPGAVLALLLTARAHAEPPPVPSPDPRGAFAADRHFDMLRLQLHLTIDPAARGVAGTATWTVRRLSPGALRLDAVALDVSGAEVDGKAVPVRIGPAALEIDLPPTARDAESTVVIHYRATPQNGLHWRAPGAASPDTYTEVWSQGEGEDNRYWFPSYDRPDDRFAYEGVFDAPAGWTVVTNSGPDLPSYLVMLAAGPYQVVTGSGATPIRAFVAPGTPESWVRPALDPIPDMLAWYAQRTGVPYAWGHYDQLFVQRFLYGGMENTSATIETDRMIAPPAVHATRSWVPSIAAHELAHQWYGDLLTGRTWRDLWLNEGFATFFAADWEVHARRSAEGDAAGDAHWAAEQDGWRRASLDNGSLAGRWFLNGGGATRNGGGALQGEANHNVYSKGAAVLNMLRAYLGDDIFWAAIADYTRAHAHGPVETIDLQRAMEARSGYDLAWFFQQWTELPGVPKVWTSWSWSAEHPGAELSVTLHQTGVTYTLPVDIQADGGARTRVWLTGADATVTLPAATAPAFVAVDPDGGLLVDWDMQQSPQAWAAQVRNGPAYARLQALHALADAPAPADDPLPALLTDTAQPEPFREAVADALGTRRTCGPLVAAMADPDARMRLAVAGALGQCADPSVGTAALARIAHEPNADVRAALLRAGSALTPDAALPIARATLAARSADVLAVEREAAAGALGARGVPADVPRLLAIPTARDLRTSGLRASIRILQRQALGPAREALRARIADAAQAMLDDLDQREVQAGIAALRDVGDARSVARLEALARASTVPDIARAARDAVTAIGARVDTVTPATPNEVDARLDALEAELKALQDDAKTWMRP